MRILAIRGCNLASLAGEFEIDLAGAPLGGAGVFAIVGNTGAGKSTLLDAMCVALFDRTPRLGMPSRVQVGRGPDDPLALGANDVRTILRRGATAGWAEVDFESGDARRYRARWSVRRARGHTDGNLQDQQVSLADLGGEVLGGTKTETLRAIQQRLGLSFDQFRRSALLAQGEFAAFLRADGKDRSELLERMTGTEIYSRLSIAAHERAAAAEVRLRDARVAAAAIAVASDDVREAMARELAAAQVARGDARERLAAVEAAARWVGEARRRGRELEVARVAHADAVAAGTAAEVVRAELVLRRRAEGLRPRWDDASRVDRELAIATSASSAAERAAGAARERLAALGEHASRVETAHAPLRAARVAAGLVERAAEAWPVDVPALDARVAAVIAAGVAARASVAWLDARAAVAPEVAAWPELDGRLAQHVAIGDAIAAIDRELAGKQAERDRLAKLHATAAGEHREVAGALELAQRKAAGLRERRATASLDAARRAEDDARKKCEAVERLAATARAARETTTRLAELDRARGALDDAAAADAMAAARHATARDTALVLRGERERVVADLRRAGGLAHARAELVAGEPCPLCGATEHPWHGRGALSDAIGAAEVRLAEAGAQLDGAVRTLAAIAARDDARALERRRLADARAIADAARATCATSWRGQLGALGELLLVGDPADPGAEQLAAERGATAAAALEAARATRGHVEASFKAATEAQQQVVARQADVDQLAARLASVERDRRSLDTAIERQRGEREVRLAQHAELAASLTTSLARWAAALPATDLGPLGRAIPPAAASLDAPAWRRTLAPIAEAWRRHADVVALADGALAAAQIALAHLARGAERAAAEQVARHAELVARRDALAVELAAAGDRLATARIEAGFDADELRRLLASDAAHAGALAEELAAVDRAIERTRTVVGERARQVDEHAATRPAAVNALAAAPCDVDALVAIAAREELAATTAATEADERAARLAEKLAADGEARARREAALAAIAADEAACEVDRVLGAVIGSHDGKLFRSFAQSLTLDGLLAVANAHLEELAPRYQLERVPRHDLELQVIDRDLGGELRSVNSLSGGESFLVSLALALGLSSMSAHDVRVRTLLIDEGFGTLDPTTLDSALAVLDRLQATGRQVGVISHVPALVERVGAHVRVVQRGGGRSEVIVATA